MLCFPFKMHTLILAFHVQRAIGKEAREERERESQEEGSLRAVLEQQSRMDAEDAPQDCIKTAEKCTAHPNPTPSWRDLVEKEKAHISKNASWPLASQRSRIPSMPRDLNKVSTLDHEVKAGTTHASNSSAMLGASRDELAR